VVENQGNIIQRKLECMEYLNKRQTRKIFHQQAVVQLTEIKTTDRNLEEQEMSVVEEHKRGLPGRYKSANGSPRGAKEAAP